MPKHEILFLVFSYFLGALPFGYLLCYLTDKKDIREEGSGNIGAANVLRIKGKTFGFITLALDMLKGILPILYGAVHFDSPVLILGGGACAILGHLFSFYLKFKGGKGVSTFWGMCAVFYLPSALAFVVVFLFTYVITRYISTSSIAGITAVFFVILFTNVVEVSLIVFALVLLIVIKHSANIKRIIDGTEHQLIWKKNA